MRFSRLLLPMVLLLSAVLLMSCEEDKDDDGGGGDERADFGTFSLEVPGGWKRTASTIDGFRWTLVTPAELTMPAEIDNLEEVGSVPGFGAAFMAEPMIAIVPIPGEGESERPLLLLTSLISVFEEEGMRVVEMNREQSFQQSGLDAAEVVGEIEVTVEGEEGRFWVHAALFRGGYEYLLVAAAVPARATIRYRGTFEDVIQSVREEGLGNLPTRLADFERQPVGDVSLEVPAGWVVSHKRQEDATWAVITPRAIMLEDTYFDPYYWRRSEFDLADELADYAEDIPLLTAYFENAPVMALVSGQASDFGYEGDAVAYLQRLVEAATGRAPDAADVENLETAAGNGALYRTVMEVTLPSRDPQAYAFTVAVVEKEGRLLIFGASIPSRFGNPDLLRMITSLRFEEAAFDEEGESRSDTLPTLVVIAVTPFASPTQFSIVATATPPPPIGTLPFASPTPLPLPTLPPSWTPVPAVVVTEEPAVVMTEEPAVVMTEEPAVAEMPCAVHRVEAGDTLSSIAARYGVTMQDLITYNGLTDSQALFLQVGQTLVIPQLGCPTVIAPTPVAVRPTFTSAPGIVLAVVNAGQLESESIILFNQGATRNLRGWALVDEDGNRFTFPSVRLLAAATLNVFTRRGENTPTRLFWNLDAPVWESGERVQVLNAAGVVQSEYRIP